MKHKSLFELITSDQNIYNAIYSLESYVFEKGLLSKEDMDLYVRLTDKYDKEFIKGVIKECKARIEEILENDKLFEITVFFKAKKYDESSNKFTFRPIHTTNLIDQICMICMLQPLMFDDDASKRTYSEISKLIPHNFFGNIPSCRVDDLFVRWQKKYKEYSDTIVHKCHEYKETRQYTQEVYLDMIDFFPTINPAYIFNFIREKMKLIFEGCTDELDTVLVKLLYFHIKKGNLDGWRDAYYKNEIQNSDNVFMNRGIAQGLPQAYYFGNLYMVRVAELVQKEIPGDAYYYVDDSVVFTNAVDDETLSNKIESLNGLLKKLEEETSAEACLGKLATADAAFQKQLIYGTRIHNDEKSYVSSIDDSYDGKGGLQHLTRQVSMAAFFGNNMDEIEDNLSKDKIEKLIEVIENELKRIGDSDKYRTKLLKRHKKYFLYRLKQLTVREQGVLTKDYIERFYNLFQIKQTPDNRDLNRLSERFDEEIFQTECRLIVNLIEPCRYNNFESSIVEFEKQLCTSGNTNYLYYKNDIRGAKQYSEREHRSYSSLDKFFRKRYHLFKASAQEKRQMAIDHFISGYYPNTDLNTFPSFYKAFVNETTRFVFNNSEEYTRRIYNAFYSTIYGFEVSDRHNFCKTNNRSVTYSELRIMAYLRNRQFKRELFDHFAYEVCHNEDVLLGKMPIFSMLILCITKTMPSN